MEAEFLLPTPGVRPFHAGLPGPHGPERLKEADPRPVAPWECAGREVRELRGLPASGSFPPVATRLGRPVPNGTSFFPILHSPFISRTTLQPGEFGAHV